MQKQRRKRLRADGTPRGAHGGFRPGSGRKKKSAVTQPVASSSHATLDSVPALGFWPCPDPSLHEKLHCPDPSVHEKQPEVVALPGTSLELTPSGHTAESKQMRHRFIPGYSPVHS